MRRVRKRLKMSKFERLLYIFAIVLLLSSPITIVFSKSVLSQVNFEVEKTKNEIVEQTKVNESLTMIINELASLEKIQEVAKEQGLSYNNDSIKVIE